MDYWLLLLLIGLIGLFAGFLSGMLGIGGGSVRIPLLYLIGIPLINAYGINLLTIPLSSLFGTYLHRSNVQIKAGLFLIIGGVTGTVAGTLLALHYSIYPLILATIFVVVSIISVVGLNLYKYAPAFADKFNPKPVVLISGGIILNFLTGLRGGSGGSLFPPFLRTMKFNIRESIATSLFATIFTSTVGAIIFWNKGEILWIEGLIVFIGSFIGVRLGSFLSIKTKPRYLEIILSIVVVIFAFITLVKALLS
ncbi:MAG: sulfite exporter TauE/SafE family protein [Candidatus Heimdallarchaeaceae archaeon]